MADSNFRGPLVSMGSLEAEYTAGFQGNSTTASIEPMDGPMGAYQGVTMLDPRAYPINKDGLLPGRVPGFMNNPFFCGVDNVPQASASNVLAAAQVVTVSTPMALATVGVAIGAASAAQIAVSVPLVPMGTTVVVQVLAIDFGWTQGTTTANSSTVQVTDNTQFTEGQWIVIGNVANSSATDSLVTQVMSISSSNLTTITVSPSPATALGAPIGAANLWGSTLLPAGAQFGPTNSSATAVSKTLQAGMQRVHNPGELLARNLWVQASASTGGTSAILVTGYDVWGEYMTELITATGTTAAFGKKAWKYILAATPQASGAASYSLGVGDVFGYPFRADEWPQTLNTWGNTSVISSQGFTPATTVANNTAGDVRGTLQLGSNGLGSAVLGSASPTGSLRLAMYQSPAVYRLIAANPNNTVPLFGIAQSTT